MPFTWGPSWFTAPSWSALNFGLAGWGLDRLLAHDPRKKRAAQLVALAGIVVATDGDQSNLVVAGAVLLAFDAYEKGRLRLAAHLVAETSAPYDLRVASSTDGVTWAAPVQLPRDGSQNTAWYQSLAIDSKGNAAVSAYINGGSGDNACGGPRILRSSDLKTWAACGADADKKYADIGGKYVDSYFTHENKLTMAFDGTLGDDQSGSGVVLWREP